MSQVRGSGGRMVDVAINHNSTAVSLHQANHPQTKHYVSDVFEVDPREVCGGRRPALLWASPDCTFHSKARGGKPIRHANKKRRALAWVVVRWAAQVRPRVIMLENVEEFAHWGPLVGKADMLRPCPKRRGRTFRKFVNLLRSMGYVVEWRELRACDYGAPTIRKRLFLIARCDGEAITWPEPTHGTGLKPFRTVAECIDWSLPMCSIFATKDEAGEWAASHGVARPIRPLAANSMRRVARGVEKFVLKAKKPFLVSIANVGEGRWGSGVTSTDAPLSTITTKSEQAIVAPIVAGVGGRASQIPERSGDQPLQTITSKADTVLVAPLMVPRYGEREGQEPRCSRVDQPGAVVVPTGNGHQVVAPILGTYYGHKLGAGVRGQQLDEPLATQTTENRHALTVSFLAQNNGGFADSIEGKALSDPLATVLANGRGHHGLIAAHIQRDFGQSVGHLADVPVGTITSDRGGHCALVYSFLQQYNGTAVGQPLDEALPTISTHDRFGLVSVKIGRKTYIIMDICMRMLAPKELYLAQGFRPGYIIDRGHDGRAITKTEQVKMVGNSVCPPLAEALVLANCADLKVRDARRAG